MIDEKALSSAMEAYSPQTQSQPDRDRLARAIAAYLQALSPGSTGETDGWVLVPKDALSWLNGEHEDGFERPAHARGNFWWRTEFKRRAMLAAAGGRDE
ncbi:hypothetical protein [Bosea sp. AS-1]|uniref:hypothetical protein n=1 Tax=Bosea sp. AS-1 TaxID=2015316 RepID=UPI000B78B54D|nr:hypothetical protein [Bosea sp. AS-1]